MPVSHPPLSTTLQLDFTAALRDSPGWQQLLQAPERGFQFPWGSDPNCGNPVLRQPAPPAAGPAFSCSLGQARPGQDGPGGPVTLPRQCGRAGAARCRGPATTSSPGRLFPPRRRTRPLPPLTARPAGAAARPRSRWAGPGRRRERRGLHAGRWRPQPGPAQAAGSSLGEGGCAGAAPAV